MAQVNTQISIRTNDMQALDHYLLPEFIAVEREVFGDITTLTFRCDAADDVERGSLARTLSAKVVDAVIDYRMAARATA
ncbi:MAG: hypothetical protein R3D70_12230 [Rhizobiaceae bacterium]